MHSAIQARVPTLPTPTTLRAKCDEPVVPEQPAALRRERLEVSAVHRVQPLPQLLVLGVRSELLDRHDQRGVADDARLAVDLVGELGKGLQVVARAGLGQDRARPLGLPPIELGPVAREQRLAVEQRVPDGEGAHAREFAHRGPVAGDRVEHDPAAMGRREPLLAPGDHDAGGKSLDVPLPRPGMRLVEVVEVECEPPLRRAEQTEVRQMRVAAQLHGPAARRRRGQIGGHDERGAAEEGERRGEHPAVADRHQLRHSRGVLAAEQVDRIRTRRRGLPRGVGATRDGRAHRLAALRRRRHRSVRPAADSASRQPCRDLLQQPGVAVRIAERRE